MHTIKQNIWITVSVNPQLNLTFVTQIGHCVGLAKWTHVHLTLLLHLHVILLIFSSLPHKSIFLEIERAPTLHMALDPSRGTNSPNSRIAPHVAPSTLHKALDVAHAATPSILHPTPSWLYLGELVAEKAY